MWLICVDTGIHWYINSSSLLGCLSVLFLMDKSVSSLITVAIWIYWLCLCWWSICTYDWLTMSIVHMERYMFKRVLTIFRYVYGVGGTWITCISCVLRAHRHCSWTHIIWTSYHSRMSLPLASCTEKVEHEKLKQAWFSNKKMQMQY